MRTGLKSLTTISLLANLLLATPSANADKLCVYFVGDGKFLSPTVATRFVSSVKEISSLWKDCTRTVRLISVGKETQVYDEEENTFHALNDFSIDGPASAATLLKILSPKSNQLKANDTVQIYIGDHGDRNGSHAIDSPLTPKILKEAAKKLSNQGVSAKYIFDHCWAGNMQEALFDAQSGEMYGCGLSGSNDNLGIGRRGSVLGPTKASLNERADRSQQFINGDADDSLKNDVITTSDRFLFNYIQKHPEQQCNEAGVSNLLNGQKDALQNILNHDVVQEIRFYERSEKIAKSNSEIALQTLGKGPVAPKYAKTLKELNDLESKLTASANLSYLKWAKTRSEVTKAIDELHGLQANLEKCREKGSASATQCPGYERYINLLTGLTTSRNDYLKQIKVGATSATKDFSPNGQTYTVEKMVDLLHDITDELYTYQYRTQKLNEYTKRKTALLLMLKNNDQKSIALWKKLKRCEQWKY